MNINQLEYLVVAVRKRSFAGAAKKLYVSPQAISKAVSGLEKELRLKLFEKSSRGIEPTQCGALFAMRAIEVIDDYRNLKHYADSLRFEGGGFSEAALRVAVSSSPYEGGVIPAEYFQDFTSRHSGIILSISFSPSGSCLSALNEGLFDSAIILGRFRSSGFTCVKIYDTTLRIALSKLHPLAKCRLISLVDLEKYPIAQPSDIRYFRPALSRHFDSRNITPKFVELPPLINEYNKFFQEDLGIVFVTSDPCLHAIHSDVTFASLLPEDSLQIPVCFVYKKSNYHESLKILHRSLIHVSVLKKVFH